MTIFNQLDTSAAHDPQQRMRRELLASLAESPPRIAPKFFYDPAGCELYEQICRLPEYYPPRIERRILDTNQAAILQLLPRDAQLVDIGCGDGQKAWRWLEAGVASRYVGVDIAPDWLAETLQRGRNRFPHVQFDGIVTDLTLHRPLQAVLDDPRPAVIAYPGSSIGNFEPEEAIRLLALFREHLAAGGCLLLGVDGPVSKDRMVLAYDDPDGITAAFNLNVLCAVNRILESGFDTRAFRHRAIFDEVQSRIEMHLVSRHAQEIPLGQGHFLRLDEGDFIVTEHSYKYTSQRILQMLASAGYGEVRAFAVPGEGFGVYVAWVGDAQ